ncbi:hypothetical protein E2C01_078384 [Portunus trituberculatus]|uniref:Uncharacterized protein n=1 Tax=Portunus trituberculatus TaxID=210409 RepID=A0A5B7INP5_PORTR|nr:hypothetical protein [Portunus trituberculatus]
MFHPSAAHDGKGQLITAGMALRWAWESLLTPHRGVVMQRDPPPLWPPPGTRDPRKVSDEQPSNDARCLINIRAVTLSSIFSTHLFFVRCCCRV